MKKTLTILLLILAHAILLGHNIIPHHHHDYNCDFVTDKHHHDHEHNHDHDHGLDEPVSLCVHDDNGLVFINQQVLNIDISKQIISIDFDFTFIIEYFESVVVQQLFFRPKVPDNIGLFSILPNGLRAPPIF